MQSTGHTSTQDWSLRHGRREEVRLEEVAPDRRAPVLKAYLERAPNARAHLPVDKEAPLAEFERMAHRFPVFRVAVRDSAISAMNIESHAASLASSEEKNAKVQEPLK